MNNAGHGAKQRQDWAPCKKCMRQIELEIARITSRILQTNGLSVIRANDRARIEHAKGVRE